MLQISKNSFFLVAVFFMLTGIRAQTLYYSDIFKGGITGGGCNPGSSPNVGFSDIDIPIGVNIRKAFLFASAVRSIGFSDFPEPRVIFVNGQSLLLDENLSLNNNYISTWAGSDQEYKTVVYDISAYLTSNLQQIQIDPPIQISSGIDGVFVDYYILVLYDENSLPEVVVDVFVNKQNMSGFTSYNLTSSSVMDTLNDVGFAFNSTNMCDTIVDGSYVYVDGQMIGLVGGTDHNNAISCAGVTGAFNYENGILQGLGDDNEDSIVKGTDGLANIQNYLLSNTGLNVLFEYQNPAGLWPSSNTIHQLFLAYTTPCAPFEVTAPSDTTLCQGSTLKLNATGGQSYEWLPSTGLSCSNCPNPIFTADSSMFYTVRIWNNDSCSVVRPLKINVRPQPTFGAITATPSECGANTGTVTLKALPNNGIVTNWQEVGGAAQTSNLFQNLSTGNHTFFFVDTNGCQSADTTVFVGEVNSTVASFTVSPQSGAVPLSVTISNTSQNAANYEWFLNGVSQGSSFVTSTFAVSGSYEIMLVAWQHAPNCADTAYQTVVVFDSLVVTLPNVFTPNFDGANDFFTLTANQNVTYELVILNRWGNVVFEENSNLVAGVTKNVWGGTDYKSAPNRVTDGVYFVKLRVVTEDGEVLEVEDFVTVVK